MRRGFWLVAVILAIVFVLPLGGGRRFALLVALIFAGSVCYASRRDFLERNAPTWPWLTVGVVSLLLSPLGGFVLWMLLRRRWARPTEDTQAIGAPAYGVAPMPQVSTLVPDDEW
jgi:hypothetical protein